MKIILISFTIFMLSYCSAEDKITTEDKQDIKRILRNHKLKWNDKKNALIKYANKIRIRVGGTCHREVSKEKTIAIITDSDEVEKFKNNFQLYDPGEEDYDYECECCGDISFEFINGNKLLTTFVLAHKSEVKVPWGGQTSLTDNSVKYIHSFLKKHNYKIRD